MKSLAERHKERAQRIADNRSERTGTTIPNVAAAIVAAQNAADLYETLGDDAKDEFEAAMANYDPSANTSLSEDANGETMAGIGVINTDVVPAKAAAGNGGGSIPGWSTVPETPDFGGGNLAGKSLVDQGAGGEGEQNAEPAKKSSK